jgi:hypothetical protein
VAELILNNAVKNIISKNSPNIPQWRLAMENNQVQSTIFNIVLGTSISFGTPSAGWGLLSGMTYRNSGNVLFINGTPSSAGSVIGGSLTNGVSASIGAGFTSGSYSRFWNGDMAEILVFNSSLTAFQRQQVEGYLAWKWNLHGTLPASHPFKNAPPQ